MVKELKKTDKILTKIDMCKSDSGICGKSLRQAHYALGKELAKSLLVSEKLENQKICIFIFMRAGLCFALGIADFLDKHCAVDLYFSYKNEAISDQYDRFILVDAVINSGKTILEAIQTLDSNKVIVATNTFASKSIDLFKSINTEKSYNCRN